MSPKALLITGASRGIGRASALLAARHGWSVGVNYREDFDAAEDVVRKIAKAGGRAVPLKGDVAIEADVVSIFEQAHQALGPITGVVANAGIVAPSARLADMSAERMRRIFEVNVLGAYLTAREAARRMSESSGGAGGSIVLMSSAAARLGSPNLYVDYAGSKGAIDTLTIGLSRELGPEGVRVNAIRPGLIETEIHASDGEPDRARALGRSSPLGRPGKAQEIAEAAVWLLSDAASYVTGAILDVTGGRSAGRERSRPQSSWCTKATKQSRVSAPPPLRRPGIGPPHSRRRSLAVAAGKCCDPGAKGERRRLLDRRVASLSRSRWPYLH